MTDKSHLDQKYFIDVNVYNCPFCNRRHVAYSVYEYTRFDWSNTKACLAIFVRCQSCNKRSMHLTFFALNLVNIGQDGHGAMYRLSHSPERPLPDNLDDLFFYSVPTSFFALDTRIPALLRELLTEAEGCLKSNFLTGASACARKIVYELAVLRDATGDNYDDRIKSLKDSHQQVDGTFFDTLLTIQQVTSEKVHENSFDGWEAKHLRVILAAIAEVLHEIYVVPALRADRRKAVLALRDALTPVNSKPAAKPAK